MNDDQNTFARLRQRMDADGPTALLDAVPFLLKRFKYAFVHALQKSRFRSLGAGSVVVGPRLLSGGRFIDIGRNVFVRPGSRIEAIRWVGTHRYDPQIVIGDNCFIEFDFQVSCTSRVDIGHDVLIGGRVFISDNSHGKNPEHHRLYQAIETAPVSIGDFTWIGQNACILKGVSLGRGCIVAAGAVVTKSFGDRAIVAGVPAKQIGEASS